MLDDLLVSIVLPTYNGARFLSEAIQSCLDQTHPNWELIIVDDASTDQTPEIIARYCAKDSRIRSIRHETNKKLPTALNTGFSLARGDFFTWTSDDNKYRKHALSRLLEFLRSHPDVGIVYSSYTLIDEEGNLISKESPLSPKELPFQNVVGPCFLYRRIVHEMLGGYDRSLFRAEDYDFWLRASQKFTLARLPEDLYQYRSHQRSLSVSYPALVSGAVKSILERCLIEMNWDDADRSLAFLRLAWEAGSSRDLQSMGGYLAKAVRSSPRSVLGMVTSLGARRVRRGIRRLGKSVFHALP